MFKQNKTSRKQKLETIKIKIMKTMKTIFTLVLAVFVYGAVMASGNLRVNITGLNNSLTEVEILNAKMSMFEIEVKNEKGELVFYKETKSPATNYTRKYDFSKLENGVYFFTVKIDNESKETKFNMENGKMTLLKQTKMVEPVFMFDDNQFKLSFLNFEGENTSLTVYDSNRNQLYQKDLKSDFVTQHGLDFSKVNRGSYRAVLSAGNNAYSYDIFVD